MNMRVFLWGFMGSGKTFLGKSLADALQVPFYDLDAEIETATGTTISTLFAEKGEPCFRTLETDTLHTFQHKPAFILACGGGTPCHADNAAWMKKQGITVWLNPPVEVLVRRLLPEKQHRPLLAQVPDTQLETVIREKLAQRSTYYSQAHLIIRDEHVDIPAFKNQLLLMARQYMASNPHP